MQGSGPPGKPGDDALANVLSGVEWMNETCAQDRNAPDAGPRSPACSEGELHFSFVPYTGDAARPDNVVNATQLVIDMPDGKLPGYCIVNWIAAEAPQQLSGFRDLDRQACSASPVPPSDLCLPHAPSSVSTSNAHTTQGYPLHCKCCCLPVL
jgi:hypothetical protein